MYTTVYTPKKERVDQRDRKRGNISLVLLWREWRGALKLGWRG
jgi:hypothetical protein